MNCQANTQFFVNLQLKENMSYKGPMPAKDYIRKILILKIKGSSVYYNYPMEIFVFESTNSTGMSWWSFVPYISIKSNIHHKRTSFFTQAAVSTLLNPLLNIVFWPFAVSKSDSNIPFTSSPLATLNDPFIDSGETWLLLSPPWVSLSLSFLDK